jgi:hypothetical protein
VLLELAAVLAAAAAPLVAVVAAAAAALAAAEATDAAIVLTFTRRKKEKGEWKKSLRTCATDTVIEDNEQLSICGAWLSDCFEDALRSFPKLD